MADLPGSPAITTWHPAILLTTTFPLVTSQTLLLFSSLLCLPSWGSSQAQPSAEYGVLHWGKERVLVQYFEEKLGTLKSKGSPAHLQVGGGSQLETVCISPSGNICYTFHNWLCCITVSFPDPQVCVCVLYESLGTRLAALQQIPSHARTRIFCMYIENYGL